MHCAVIFGTTEGHTLKIARFVQERVVAQGHHAMFAPAEGADDDFDLADFDTAILAGSIHAGRYQKSLAEFARMNADRLNGMRTMFISVSLTAAGSDPEDLAELDACAERFVGKTGWTPSLVVQVAGALKFSEYDFFRYWAVRWIAKQKLPGVVPGEDREFTNWSILGELVDRWIDTSLAFR